MKRVRGRLSYANLAATLALFIALGGSSYAAFSLPKNSVGTKQLRNAAVTKSKIAKNAVGSEQLKDGSLLARDFASGQLTRGPAGPTGPKGDPGLRGPQGVQGAQGEPGPAGFSGYQQVTVEKQSNTDASLENQTIASCPTGKVVVGGGAEVVDPTAAGRNVVIEASFPAGTSKWVADALEVGSFANFTLRATAICANHT